MAEENGTERRLDRVEALLADLAERQREFRVIQERDHEEFTRDHKQLMTWQVLMQEKMDRYTTERDAERKRLDALSEITDRRVADLVTAIGKLIERLPPPNTPATSEA
ncbi:MAG TPA: hypothetical protein VHZ55_21515 [Bryobacteraceae bacterium]|jgi:flagellar biosynthesis chaperone FliJ|nr:hypothetical protein [Bryobacteraceae bacterium]